MDNGEWTMENGQWRMDNGEWRMDNVPPRQKASLIRGGLSFTVCLFCGPYYSFRRLADTIIVHCQLSIVNYKVGAG